MIYQNEINKLSSICIKLKNWLKYWMKSKILITIRKFKIACKYYKISNKKNWCINQNESKFWYCNHYKFQRQKKYLNR